MNFLCLFVFIPTSFIPSCLQVYCIGKDSLEFDLIRIINGDQPENPEKYSIFELLIFSIPDFSTIAQALLIYIEIYGKITMKSTA